MSTPYRKRKEVVFQNGFDNDKMALLIDSIKRFSVGMFLKGTKDITSLSTKLIHSTA